MNFELTPEARALGDSLDHFFRKRYSFADRTKALSLPLGWEPELWRSMARDLELIGTAFPEGLGGAGGGVVENMVVMQALGRALLPEPYFSTAVISGGFLQLAQSTFPSQMAQAIVRGTSICAFAQAEPESRYDHFDIQTSARRETGGWRMNGRKSLVRAAPWASHLIVTARMEGGRSDKHGVTLLLLPKETPGIRCLNYLMLDGVPASDIWFDNVIVNVDAVIGEPGDASPLIDQVVDQGIAALCAEGVGCIREMIELSIAYCSQRKQFGQPIAQFQAVQHRLAEMQVALEQATSATYLATLSLDAAASERASAVSAGKVTVGKAMRLVGQNAIQLHGGIGTTNELAVAHLFKRITVMETQLGSTEHHLRRYARLNRQLSAAVSSAQWESSND